MFIGPQSVRKTACRDHNSELQGLIKLYQTRFRDLSPRVLSSHGTRHILSRSYSKLDFFKSIFAFSRFAKAAMQ